MAPVDRLLRADRLSQTVPPAACPHQRTPVAPSWPPRIIAVTSEIRTGQRQELFFEAPIILSVNAWSVVTASVHSRASLRYSSRRRRSTVNSAARTQFSAWYP